MSTDLGLLYRNARFRISALVTDEVAETVVAATPEWTVHDVTAHLAGIVEDVGTGNLEGATTDPWTAAQVERGRNKSISQLVEEWSIGASQLEGFLSSPAGAAVYRAVVDIHTHEADLCTALGLTLSWPEDFVDWAAPVMLEAFHHEVAEKGLPLAIVVASPFEIIRSRLGRRTESEVVAYDWSNDPAAYLDTWFVFGRRESSLGES